MMDREKFPRLLSPRSQAILNECFALNPQKVTQFNNAAASALEADMIPALEMLLGQPGFQRFLRRRRAATPVRFAQSLELLLGRLALDVPPDLLGHIALEMSLQPYQQQERTYFVVPLDQDGHRSFERGFLQVGEQSMPLLVEYLRFVSAGSLALMRKAYQDGGAAAFLFEKLIGLLLAKRTAEVVLNCVDLLNDEAFKRLYDRSHRIEKGKLLLLNVVNVFHSHSDPNLFFEFLRAFSTRYTSLKQKSDQQIVERLGGIWDFLLTGEKAHVTLFREFLKFYGQLSEEFECFVWDSVFSLEGNRIPAVFELFNSSSFSSLRGYYGQDISVLKLLIRNIIAAVAEFRMRNFTVSLHKVVLKLLLGTRVDRRFLRRRAQFFEVLKKHTNCIRIEMEVIRFLFFEYLFISLGQVTNDRDMKMTKFCDDLHREFCSWMDSKDRAFGRGERKLDYYMPLISKIRDSVWSAVAKRFGSETYRLGELQAAAVSLSLEDHCLSNLEQIEPDDLTMHHESFMEIFRTSPERSAEAMCHDFWYRFTLDMALPHAHAAILPIIGSVQIEQGHGGAYTNGKTIFLPEYVNFFKDKLDPVVQNRNLTYYIGLALHEAGHIIAGSFRFNLVYYLRRLERPDIFKAVMNLVEDYRIENFLVKIKAHPQVKEILDISNEFLSVKRPVGMPPLAWVLLFHIFDGASDFGDRIHANPDYQKRVEALYSAGLNTGRFTRMKEFCEYCIERLKNMELSNPLAAYPLAREIYEVLRYWPEAELIGILDPPFYTKGIHEVVGNTSRSGPVTDKDLEKLYEECNKDPAGFLTRHGLPVFPELIPSASGPDARQENRARYTDEIVGSLAEEYESAGVIDFSRRTAADDLSAEARIHARASEDSGKSKARTSVRESTGAKKQSKKKKKKHVYSIDPRTRSRTSISEIKEFEIRQVNNAFLSWFRKWEGISNRVARLLSRIVPSLREEAESSMLEGDLDMESLIEHMSDPGRGGGIELLERHNEVARSLKVVIGIDASGSTMIPVNYMSMSEAQKNALALDMLMSGSDLPFDRVIDIEKAFAMVFGKAMSYLTDDVSYYAFDSITSTNVYHALSVEAVSSIQPGASNRDGDFLRYIKEKLLRSSADVKYFFMISDGQPNSDNYSGKQALDDTLIAMREVVNAGIKLVYFNIDMQRGMYFDTFRREATYAEHFSHPEELLPAIPEMVRQVVRSIQ